MSRRDGYAQDPALEVVTGVCPHDCPDTCAWQVAVERASGRAIDIWGHPDHPVSDGKLCTKVDNYLDRTYHAGRLRTPLRRVGPKGAGQFEPIGWDEALQLAAAELRAVVDRHGAESVLPYSYAGTMGLIQGEGFASRFFHRLGASRLARTICAEAGFEGLRYTLGTATGPDPLDFEHARLILIWGSNTLTSNLHLWPVVQRARKRGARVIVIDPARTRTARAADEWIPIRPGTDGALALALMHVLVRDDLVDRDYLDAHTTGFAELAEAVLEWTPTRAEQHTGIPAARIEALAEDYGRTRPTAIRINYGLQRHAGGGMAVRTIACLPALVGDWRHRGGGVLLSQSGAFPIDRNGLDRPDLLGARTPRTINMNRLGDALSMDPARLARAHHHPCPTDPRVEAAQAGPPVHALVVYNTNPAAVAPDQAAVTRGLEREDLFTIVLEQFETDTARFADLLLPATTQLEHWDLLKPYGHLYLALNRPAIEPVGEARPNSAIFRGLARAMGFGEACFDESDESAIASLLGAQTAPCFEGIDFDRLVREGFARLAVPTPYLPFAEGGYGTRTGKCELFSQRMIEDGYPGVPTYTPPAIEDRPADDDRLACISPPAHSFLNSSFVNLAKLARREKGPRVDIHPDDAAARGIADGDRVRLWNELGELPITARVTEDVVPGTVLAPGVWWREHGGGVNVNQVVPQTEADMGSGACFYDTLVRVERI